MVLRASKFGIDRVQFLFSWCIFLSISHSKESDNSDIEVDVEGNIDEEQEQEAKKKQKSCTRYMFLKQTGDINQIVFNFSKHGPQGFNAEEIIQLKGSLFFRTFKNLEVLNLS